MQPVDLFDYVLPAYAAGGDLTNEDLYRSISEASGLPTSAWEERSAVGASGEMHSLLKRRARWWQQSLRQCQLLERVDGKRGTWRITPKGKRKLTPAADDAVMLGFSTTLGVALWAKAESAFPFMDEPIHLCLSSLPYVLRHERAYGGAPENAYVDWAMRLLEPIVMQLAPGGSIALNLGNDCFEPGTPARSLYKERLLLNLVDGFGLSLMDTFVWENPCRPPGPLQWSSRTRQQLNGTYEPIYWLTNDPGRCFSNNRRVLQPHTADHLALIARGGESRRTSHGDGSHRVYPGSYAKPTEGRIPRNVIRMSHMCQDKRDVAALARAAGLPVHGATMPLKLARFLIEFLTEPNHLVADPCAGWFTTAKAAEQLGRRWFATEQMGEYVLGGALGMRESAGFEMYGGVAA